MVGFFQRIVKADLSVVRISLHPVYGSLSDATFRDIDNTLHGNIILTVINGFQVRQNVLDFFSGIKVHAAYHIIGNTFRNHTFFQKAGLGVGTVKHRIIPIASLSSFDAVCNIVRNVFGFLICRIELAEMNLAAVPFIRPELFLFSSHIVVDNGICCI